VTKGDRVRIKPDHWTGIGSDTGTVKSNNPKTRTLVLFDDGVLVEVNIKALDTIGAELEVSSPDCGQAQPRPTPRVRRH
jgi:hypothetical protein